MLSLQDLEVQAIMDGEKYKVTGRLHDGDVFSITQPLESNLLTLKQGSEFVFDGVPWVANALLRVEMVGQQGTRCSVELPYPDIHYGRSVVVRNDMLKTPAGRKAAKPAQILESLKKAKK